MLKKTLLSVVVSLGLVTMFTTGVFASVDITLEDDTENNAITVSVNSNEEYLDGIDLSIIYSDGVEIDETEVLQSEEFCSMTNNVIFSTGNILLECLNDSGTVVEGVLLTIPYTIDSDDYYFYVDTDNLDLGTRTLGNVVNINKPEEASDEIEETEETDTLVDIVLGFVSENYFYLAAGALLVVALVVVIVMLTNKEKLPEKNTTPSEIKNKAE